MRRRTAKVILVSGAVIVVVALALYLLIAICSDIAHEYFHG